MPSYNKQSDTLKSTVEYLTDAFPQQNKQLKKINIPILIYLADVAMDAEIKPMYFRQWWEFFTEEDALFEDYKRFCSTGSTKLEKVNGRLAVTIRNFCSYHEIEIPEELKDMVAEVEEKIAAMKAESMEPEPAEAGAVLEEKEGGNAPDTGNAGREETIAEPSQEEPEPAGQEEASAVEGETEVPENQEAGSEIPTEGTGQSGDTGEPSDADTQEGSPFDNAEQES